MNSSLLRKKVQDYIFNYKDDTIKLAFAGSPFLEVSTQELLQQIESRKAVKKKLPTWFTTKNIIYPPKLNLEQTSSEITAQYKATLVNGKTLADITGGFGVDSYFFAEKFDRIVHTEQNNALSEIAQHNFSVLNKGNIDCIQGDGLTVVEDMHFDVIFVDPSRRDKKKGKVFFLEDCEPNVIENLHFLLERCDQLLIKTSPMLDISAGLKSLQFVTEIHCVAINNDVKELLWLLNKNVDTEPQFRTVNFTSEEIQNFDFSPEQEPETIYAPPQRFLYEPNAAILKSGGFDYISEAFKVKKLHKHSHLFTSESLRDFPGRRFSIEKIIPYSKKEMRNGITFEKANITTRNFPQSVATLRKKWKIKDGGDIYLFFTTLENKDKIMLICAKV